MISRPSPYSLSIYSYEIYSIDNINFTWAKGHNMPIKIAVRTRSMRETGRSSPAVCADLKRPRQANKCAGRAAQKSGVVILTYLSQVANNEAQSTCDQKAVEQQEQLFSAHLQVDVMSDGDANAHRRNKCHGCESNLDVKQSDPGT